MATFNGTTNDLTEIVHLHLKDEIKKIIEEEAVKASENVHKRVTETVESATVFLLERIDYTIHEKQIVYSIKPKD